MSKFCEIILGLGISIFGCGDTVPVTNNDVLLPKDDQSIWEFKKPEPKPEPIIIEKKVEVKKPDLPPVVIEKTIINNIPAPEPQIIEKRIYIEREPEPEPKPRIDKEYFNNFYKIRIKSANDDLSEKQNINFKDKKVVLDNTDISVSGSEKLSGIKKQNKPEVKKYEADNVKAGEPINNDYIFTADRYINGVLETGINSQIDGEDGGSFIIQTAIDAFGYHGRYKLVPKGSRLLCKYKAPEELGITRLQVTCNRLLIGDYRAEIYNLEANAGDVQGHLGISGEVDNRFF